jgi:hypothetical protein
MSEGIPGLFARFSSKDNIEVNASMSSAEYNVQFLHTWPRSMEINPKLEYYIMEAKAKMNPQNDKLKYRDEIATSKKFDSYKNKTKVKIHVDEIKNIFNPRTKMEYISVLCEVRISRRLNVAEVTLRFSSNDLLPVCKFEKIIPEEPIVVDGLLFFQFKNIS